MLLIRTYSRKGRSGLGMLVSSPAGLCKTDTGSGGQGCLPLYLPPLYHEVHRTCRNSVTDLNHLVVREQHRLVVLAAILSSLYHTDASKVRHQGNSQNNLQTHAATAQLVNGTAGQRGSLTSAGSACQRSNCSYRCKFRI